MPAEVWSGDPPADEISPPEERRPKHSKHSPGRDQWIQLPLPPDDEKGGQKYRERRNRRLGKPRQHDRGAQGTEKNGNEVVDSPTTPHQQSYRQVPEANRFMKFVTPIEESQARRWEIHGKEPPTPPPYLAARIGTRATVEESRNKKERGHPPNGRAENHAADQVVPETKAVKNMYTDHANCCRRLRPFHAAIVKSSCGTGCSDLRIDGVNLFRI